MDIGASHDQPSVAASSLSSQAIVPDADFETRWAAWVVRGRAHDQRVRRRFLVWIPIIAVAAAIAFALSTR